MFILKGINIHKTSQRLGSIIEQSKFSSHEETTIIKNHFKIGSNFFSNSYCRNYNKMKLYHYSN